MGNSLVQMNARMTTHVVLLSRVCEEIGLRSGFYAGIEERQTMLRHDSIIVVARDNLQLALQVTGFVEEACLGVAL